MKILTTILFSVFILMAFFTPAEYTEFGNQQTVITAFDNPDLQAELTLQKAEVKQLFAAADRDDARFIKVQYEIRWTQKNIINQEDITSVNDRTCNSKLSYQALPEHYRRFILYPLRV